MLFDPETLVSTGTAVLRYGLVLLLLGIGVLKFFAFEAEAIRPLVEHSPLVRWLYRIFSVRGASAFFGVFEILAGILIALSPWAPGLSAIGSLLTIPMFVVTLSFLFTTPGALNPVEDTSAFLLKDLVLLGAGLYTAGEALSRSH